MVADPEVPLELVLKSNTKFTQVVEWSIQRTPSPHATLSGSLFSLVTIVKLRAFPLATGYESAAFKNFRTALSRKGLFLFMRVHSVSDL